MNWQHLMYFLKVAEYESFSQAAESLFITTSALSKAISNLESKLEVPLFKKVGRNIQLTKYGKIFLAYVTVAYKEISEGVAVIQNMADLKTGTVDISCIFSVGSYYIPGFLDYLSQQSPLLNFNLAQGHNKQVLDDVVAGKSDIGFCGEFRLEGPHASLNRQALYNEEVILIVPENHSLAAKEAVTFKEIKDQVFVSYSAGTGIIHDIESTISKKGYHNFSFKTSIQANEELSMINLVKAGLGIAFVIDVPTAHLPGIKIIRLIDLYIIRTIYLVWNQDNPLTTAAKLVKNAALNYTQTHLENSESHLYPTSPASLNRKVPL